MSSEASEYTEPWMRGTHGEVPVTGRAVLHALELAQENVAEWCADLTDAEVEAEPLGLNSIAFQIRHIAGSVDRILTYAEGKQLSEAQLAALRGERSDGLSRSSLAGLLAVFEAALKDAQARIRTLAEGDIEAARGVGRKMLPTTMGGAMIHVADHTQLHVGQLICTVKVIRALRGMPMDRS